RLQHAVRLLQLSSLDFAQEVHDAMGRNPFLEVEDGGHDEPPAAAAGDGISVDLKTADGDASLSPIGDSPYERDSWQQSSSSVRRIVTDHLDRLAQHDVNGLARLLKKTPTAIEAVCERIRHLNPRPGWSVDSSTTQYITPDVLVRKIRGRWTATLNRAIVPRVRPNQTYASMFQEHRNPKNTELAQHLQEARWTVKNVQQRFSTILMVAEAILKRQQHFLEFGPMA